MRGALPLSKVKQAVSNILISAVVFYSVAFENLYNRFGRDLTEIQNLCMHQLAMLVASCIHILD